MLYCFTQDNLLLDMYLAPHVRTLYTQIRNRALIQVIVPVIQRWINRELGHLFAIAFPLVS